MPLLSDDLKTALHLGIELANCLCEIHRVAHESDRVIKVNGDQWSNATNRLPGIYGRLFKTVSKKRLLREIRRANTEQLVSAALLDMHRDKKGRMKTHLAFDVLLREAKETLDFATKHGSRKADRECKSLSSSERKKFIQAVRRDLTTLSPLSWDSIKAALPLEVHETERARREFGRYRSPFDVEYPFEDECDKIEQHLEGQPLSIFQFLRCGEQWTGYDTVRAMNELWRKPDPSDDTIHRALRRLRDELNEIEANIILTIHHKERRAKLEK